MKPDDSGLTIYQQRLLDCAKIVREGKFEHPCGFSMRAYNTCAMGEYWRAHPESSTINPDCIFPRAGSKEEDFDQQMTRHFGGEYKSEIEYWMKRAELLSLFSSDTPSIREEVAQRIENHVYKQLCKA